MKIVGRYFLLCDSCNWEFTGFALPGTVTAKPKRKRPKKKNGIGYSPHTEKQESSDLKQTDPKNFDNQLKARS